MAIRPFANSPHADKNDISVSWLIGVQTGNTPNAVSQMKYLTVDEFTAYVRSTYGSMWNYRGEFSSATPTDPQRNDYFVCTGNFTEGGQSFVSGHLYAYNGNTWDDVSNVLNQYAKQSTVNSLSSRVSAVEAVLPTTVKKADIVDALDSSDATKVLSAKQGKVLDEKIAAISGGVIFKGECTYAELLAIQNPEAGWEYWVTDKEAFYLYSVDDGWVETAGTVVQTPDETDITHALSNAKTTEMFNGVEDSIEVVSTEVENVKEVLDGTTQTNILTDPPSMANVRTITNANEILPWAILKRVGARAVSWNQLVQNGDFADNTQWYVYASSYMSFTISSGKCVCTMLQDSTGGDNTILGNKVGNYAPPIKGHVYLVLCQITNIITTNTLYPNFEGIGSSSGSMTALSNGYYYRIITASNDDKDYKIRMSGTKVTGDTWTVQNCQLFDLTAMGMDSLTADQFRTLFPASYYPQDAGEIIPLNPSAFKVVGKNKNNNANNNIGSYWTTSGVAYASGYASTERIKAVPLGTYIGSLFNKTTNARVANVVYTTFNSLDDTKALRQVTDATITLVAGENYISIRNYGDNSAYITADNFLFQLEIGSTASAYGLYSETTIDTSFTSDYKYVNENCHDYSENVLVDGVMRRKEHIICNSKTFNGAISEVWTPYGYGGFGIAVSDVKQSANNSVVGNVSANGFTAESYADMSSNARDMACAIHFTTKAIIFYVASITSEADWRTWLSTHPLTVVYEKDIPSTPTLHDPIPNFPCEDGTTVQAVTPQTDLVNAIDVPFTVEYKTDTKLIEQITTNKNDIAKIVSGVTTVGKATADGNGNNIVSTYATKSELTSEATARANADSNLLSAIDANSKRITNLETKAGDEIPVTYPSATYGMDGVPASVAPYGKVRELIMNSRVRNNYISLPSSSRTSTQNGVTLTDNRDGSYTVSTNGGTATADTTFLIETYAPLTTGHTCLMSYGVLCVSGKFRMGDFNDGNSIAYDVGAVYTATGAGVYLAVQVFSGVTVNFTCHPTLTDLNIYFGGTIPTNASTIAQIQQNYPELLIPSDHDTGTRVDTTYEAVKSKKDFFDQQMELGKYNNETGAKDSDSNRLRTVNRQPCTPNTTYYFDSPTNAYGYGYDDNGNYLGSFFNMTANSNFTTPNNCHSFAFYLTTQYGTTYMDDIHVIGELDSLTLPNPVTGKSAGSVHQIYYPETGEMTEPLGEESNLASLSWSLRDGTTKTWQTSGLSSTIKAVTDTFAVANLTNAKYVPVSRSTQSPETDDKTIAVTGTGLLCICDSELSAENIGTKLANLGLIYERATPNPNSQATDPVLDPFLKVEGNGTIRPVQSQTTQIDSAMSVDYLGV